ncbi:protein kinase, putative, partial [Entamoeba invadens IP1]
MFLVLIIIISTVLILYILFLILENRKVCDLQKKTCLFSMKSSNINFVKLQNSFISVNKTEIIFESDGDTLIDVDSESRELICVGNTLHHTVKVQFTFNTSNVKYQIRAEPQVIAIPEGKAVEFEVFLMPLCSTNIDEEITLFAVDMKKGENFQFPLKIRALTKMTTRLDFDELIEEKVIGEGSFGIVYKGIYRGNCVAIKKKKEIKNNDDDEFTKEVNMLDKFRCGYIVHFYGAVFIPNKVCMVTEFASFGSLQDLMKHKTSEEVDVKLRIKFLVDVANGILYLHENGFLHRNIKPDNILIFSMDFCESVNAKLTDFGSARSVNLLMTNMTFTKNVGTPTYMAPEIKTN